MAQRQAARVAGGEERGRHAHPVRPRQHHVGDGPGAARRRGRDPPPSGGGGVPAERRGRQLPRRTAETRGRDPSARRHRGIPRPLRHAVRRRDRHHQAPMARIPQHTRPGDPRQRQELRTRRRPAALRTRPAGGVEEGTGRAEPPARTARRGEQSRRDPADDQAGPHLHRIPGVPEVRHRHPLLPLQAGPHEGGRMPRAGQGASGEGGRLLPHLPGTPRRRTLEPGGRPARPAAQGSVPDVPRAHTVPGAHFGGRDHQRGAPARRRAGRCPGRTAGVRRDRRGAGPRHPRHGAGRSRARRHPGHGLHRPQLVTSSSESPAWSQRWAA